MSADLAVTLFRDGDLSWHDRAACAEVDPEIFFVDKGGSTRPAKRICRGCDVRAECLEYALSMERNWLAFGIWGGVAPRDRERLRMERDRRPPPGSPGHKITCEEP